MLAAGLSPLALAPNRKDTDLSVPHLSRGRLALANAIAAAGPGRHYLHVIRPMVAQEALAQVLYLGSNQLALGPVSAEHFDRLTRLVDQALSDASNRWGRPCCRWCRTHPPTWAWPGR